MGAGTMQLMAVQARAAMLILGLAVILTSSSVLLLRQATDHGRKQTFAKYGCLPQNGLKTARPASAYLGLEICH